MSWFHFKSEKEWCDSILVFDVIAHHADVWDPPKDGPGMTHNHFSLLSVFPRCHAQMQMQTWKKCTHREKVNCCWKSSPHLFFASVRVTFTPSCCLVCMVMWLCSFRVPPVSKVLVSWSPPFSSRSQKKMFMSHTCPGTHPIFCPGTSRKKKKEDSCSFHF